MAVILPLSLAIALSLAGPASAQVPSLEKLDPDPANLDTVRWRVTFSQSQVLIDESSFSLRVEGALGAVRDALTLDVDNLNYPFNTEYLVTVSNMDRSGTVELRLAPNTNIGANDKYDIASFTPRVFFQREPRSRRNIDVTDATGPEVITWEITQASSYLNLSADDFRIITLGDAYANPAGQLVDLGSGRLGIRFFDVGAGERNNPDVSSDGALAIELADTHDITDLSGARADQAEPRARDVRVRDTRSNQPPRMAAVSIASNRSEEPSFADFGDIVNLSFTTTEPLQAGSDPIVTIAGQTVLVGPANFSNPDRQNFTASLQVSNATPAGRIAFEISNLIDEQGGTGGTYSATTDGTFVNVPDRSPARSVAPPPVFELTLGATTPINAQVGDLIRFNVRVANRGTAVSDNDFVFLRSLSGGGLDASQPLSLSGPSGDAGGDLILGTGEEWTYVGTYQLTQADVDPTNGPFELIVGISYNLDLIVTETLQVTLDLNDDVPRITSADEVVMIEGLTDVIDVQAVDFTSSEGSGLTFSISGGNDRALFAINQVMGMVSFRSPPDFGVPSDQDRNNVYEFTVSVTDADGNTVSQDVEVSIFSGTGTSRSVTIQPQASSLPNQTSITFDVEFSGDVESLGGEDFAVRFDAVSRGPGTRSPGVSRVTPIDANTYEVVVGSLDQFTGEIELILIEPDINTVPGAITDLSGNTIEIADVESTRFYVDTIRPGLWSIPDRPVGEYDDSGPETTSSTTLVYLVRVQNPEPGGLLNVDADDFGLNSAQLGLRPAGSPPPRVERIGDTTLPNTDHYRVTFENVTFPRLDPTVGAGVRLVLTSGHDIQDNAGNRAVFQREDEFSSVNRQTPDPAQSSIAATPPSIVNDGLDVSRIRVVLREANNSNRLTSSAGTVVMSTDLGDISDVTNNYDGSYEATLTSTELGTATVSFTLNGAPFGGTAEVQVTTTDTEGPANYTAEIDQDPINAANQTMVSFTLGGAEVGATYAYTFTSDGGGSLGPVTGTVSAADQQFTGIDLTGLGDGEITLSVTLTDTNGNAGTPATDTATKDATAPSVTITSDPPSLAIGQTSIITFDFSETVKNFDNTDISVSGGTLSGLAGNSANDAFTASFTPTVGFQGDALIEVSATYQDAVDNAGLAGSLIIAVDTAMPILALVTISSTNPDPTKAVVGDLITVTFEASEDLGTGLDDPVVTIAGIGATVSGGPRRFTASVTVDDTFEPGLVSFAINYQDALGNPGETANQTTDGSSITIGVGPAIKQQLIGSFVVNRMIHTQNNQPDFIRYLIGSGVGGGSSQFGAFGLEGDQDAFTTSFATSLSHILQQRQNNLTQRVGGNHGHAAQGDPLGSVDSVPMPGGSPMAYAQEADRAFASGQEYLYLIGEGDNGIDRRSEQSLTAAQERGFDVWLRGNAAYSSTDGADQVFLSGQLGSHIFLSPDLIVGAMVQFDWAEETNNDLSSTVSGYGWTAGPYVAAKLPDQNLFFDAHAAWGQSRNTLELATTGSEDDFSTDRWLIGAEVSGVFEAGGWTIRPALSASYMEETQHAYVDDFGQQIRSQTFSVGELRFGPIVSHTITRPDGTLLSPMLGATGVWNFAVENGASAAASPLGSDQLRARFDAGLELTTTRDWSLDVSGYYDGLGAEDYHSYGGSAELRIPLS